MRIFRKSLLAVAALAVWTAPARPAEDIPKLIAEEDAVQVMLLRQKAVQQDLKITGAEARKIDEFATKQWNKVKGMKSLSEAERTRKLEAMTKENEKFLHDTLQKDQLHRLHQITMQVAGLLWVLRPHVASELKLTADQKQKIQELRKEAHKEAREVLHSNTAVPVKKEKLRELHAANRKRLMSVLTDAQKAKWKEMAGAPFTGQLHFEGSK
jgi:Spy/CpxP family protein refolding chaperone